MSIKILSPIFIYKKLLKEIYFKKNIPLHSNLFAPIIIFIACIFSIPSYGVEENEEISFIIKYTTTNEYGENITCEISSRDSIEKLYESQKKGCKFDLSNISDQTATLTAGDPNHHSKSVLLSIRKILVLANMALHAYKTIVSTNELHTMDSACPCSGKSIHDEPLTSILRRCFFLTHYLTHFISDGFWLIKQYLNTLPDDANIEEIVSGDMLNAQKDDLSPSQPDSGTIHTLINQLKNIPYKHHLLTLALDAAALKWDCGCPGYLFYPTNYHNAEMAGKLYFNGHLWMLLLNTAIFATDLTIDQL